MELAPYNIKVTAIHPGPIDTPFLDKVNDESGYRESLGRFILTPEEVAQYHSKNDRAPSSRSKLAKNNGLDE